MATVAVSSTVNSFMPPSLSGSIDDESLSLASYSAIDDLRSTPGRLSRKRRSERLHRTRAILSAINPAAASAVLPSEELGEADRAAIVLQKYTRRFLAMKEYGRRLFDKFEQEEAERLQRQAEQVAEGEMLVEIARLQTEVEEERVCLRNRQRYLNACAMCIQRAWRAYRKRQFYKLFSIDQSPETRVNPFLSGEEASSTTSYGSTAAQSPESEARQIYFLTTLEDRLSKVKAREERIQKMMDENFPQEDSEDDDDLADIDEYWLSDASEVTVQSGRHRMSSDFQICFEGSRDSPSSESRGMADGASLDSIPFLESTPSTLKSGSHLIEQRKVLGKEKEGDDNEFEGMVGRQDAHTCGQVSCGSIGTTERCDLIGRQDVCDTTQGNMGVDGRQFPQPDACRRSQLTRLQLEQLSCNDLQRLKKELQLCVKRASDELVCLLTIRDELACARDEKNDSIERLSRGFQQQRAWLKAAESSRSYHLFVRRERRRGWLKKF